MAKSWELPPEYRDEVRHSIEAADAIASVYVEDVPPASPRRRETLRLAADLIVFILDNPDLRFWQAMAAWMGKSIWVGNLESDPEGAFTSNHGHAMALGLHDSFYWEGKDG